MKISGVDIRPGNIIEYEGGIWKAVKIQHTQPGKGGAYMQVEMKNLIDGRKNNVRFRSAETVERVRLDTKDFQFLFRDGDALTFMDKDTYDQITLDAGIIGDAAAFLQDGMDVVLELWDERPISVQLPDTIEALIVEADAVVKGPDGVVVVQARGARERRPRDGAAAYRRGGRGSWSTCTSRPTSSARTRSGFPLRPHHRHRSRRAQGGAAAATRLQRGPAPPGEPQGPRRFRVDGRQARRGNDRRGTAQGAPRLGDAARGRRDDPGRSGQAALDRRPARRHLELPPRHSAFLDLDRGGGSARPPGQA